MKVITVKRVSYLPIGVYGVILDGDLPFALTCENNKLYIPEGEYLCNKSYYNKGGYSTYEIVVPNRTRILFHTGNIDSDSLGCILIGEEFAPLLGRDAGIKNSKYGFSEFMARIGGAESFKLVILNKS